MSEQKLVVQKYMEAFSRTDHESILSCLTDDVEWEMPGYYFHKGIEAFDKEIENPNADGHPDIKVNRMIEEGNCVVAEGTVTAKLKGGNNIDAVFCDVFRFRNGKICKLTSYVMFKGKVA
jgi:ketosteroid isomerase-like protein